MTVIAILQARLSSTRLPGKVLKNIVGKPMLQHQIERTQHANFVDKIIVATSDQTEDDAIELLCDKLNVACFRGGLNDVLDRYYHAANQFNAEHIVRLTGDCPLTDPKIIDEVITLHLKQNSDYTSNCNIPSLPDGLDVEVFTKDALNKSWKQAKKPSEREHVTQFIRNHGEIFKVINYQYPQDLSEHRWTVDEASDFEFVTQIYQNLYPTKTLFTTQDILSLLEKQPELKKINSGYMRNEGLAKSLINDKEQGYE